MLIEVFEVEKSRIRWYYMFAYGAPLIIVCISCVVDPLSYGTERYCWLRADNFFIFSFVGPVIAVILVSFFFFCLYFKSELVFCCYVKKKKFTFEICFIQ